MSYIRYTPQNLGEASDRVLSTVNALQADHEALIAHLGRSLAEWEGFASEHRHHVQHKWNQHHEHNLHILHQLHRALHISHHNSVNAETAAARSWMP